MPICHGSRCSCAQRGASRSPPRRVRPTPIARFSATVRSGRSAGSWRTMASPNARASSGDAPVRAVPTISTEPESAASAPEATAISVDLPAPFSPTRAWTSPARTSRSTDLRARTPGKVFSMAVRRRAMAPATSSLSGVMTGDAFAAVELLTGSPLRFVCELVLRKSYGSSRVSPWSMRGGGSPTGRGSRRRSRARRLS